MKPSDDLRDFDATPLAAPTGEVKDGFVMYEVDADDLYETMVVLIGNGVQEMTSPARDIKTYWHRARQFSPDDFELAIKGRAADLKPSDRERRAAVLETARLWYTALLKKQTGEEKLGLRIVPGEDKTRWRLS